MDNATNNDLICSAHIFLRCNPPMPDLLSVQPNAQALHLAPYFALNAGEGCMVCTLDKLSTV